MESLCEKADRRDKEDFIHPMTSTIWKRPHQLELLDWFGQNQTGENL